jgi:hypothetical protein
VATYLPGARGTEARATTSALDAGVSARIGRLRPALLPRAVRATATSFTVVFDNYQDVPIDSALHEVIGAAFAEISDGGRVIVVSRSEPPPTFARHLAQRAIAMLDWPELRFTPAEAVTLVQKLAPGRWSRQTIRSIHESVDGWAAGLVLRLEQARSEAVASSRSKPPGYYHPMSYYGTLPGALYGAIQRAGEACSQWDPVAQMHFVDWELIPIDCGGGWLCMTYCTLGKREKPF